MIKLVKIHRWLFLSVGLLFLTSSICAASFGTFPHQIEKQSSDLKVEYSIGFINPSSNPVEVTLSSEDSEEYNLTFSEEEFRIPSGTTDDPSGSGWYHLGGGEYAKIYQESFQADISRYREDNSLSFPVTIEAATVGNDQSGEGSQSRIVQVRNYNYRANIDPSLRPENRPEQDSGASWRDNFWQEENSNSQEDFNLEQNKSSNQDRPNETLESKQKNNSKGSGQTNSELNSSPVNKTTLMLITGIIISIGYIIMEV